MTYWDAINHANTMIQISELLDKLSQNTYSRFDVWERKTLTKLFNLLKKTSLSVLSFIMPKGVPQEQFIISLGHC